MTRCFISIDLPKEVREELNEIQKQLFSDNVKLINVKPENIHLTLKFLGELSEEEIEKVQKALKRIKLLKINARLNGLGVFPGKNFIRVIWIGIEPKEKIIGIHEMIEEELSKEGFAKDERFESHATISRIKSVKDRKAFVEQLGKIKVKQMEFEINTITLKKSTLTPEGPVYEDILKIRLE